MDVVRNHPVTLATVRRVAQLPGLTLAIECDDEGRLDDAFTNYLTNFASPEGSAAHFLLRLTEHGVECDAEGERLPADIGLGDPAVSLDEVVFRLFVHFCTDRLLIHAAAVVRAGRALLLAAPSTSGKTTLTLGLLAHGWNYLSDELAPVDAATLDVAPYPRPLHVRPRTLRVLAAQPALEAALRRRVRLVEASPDVTLGIPLAPPLMTARVPLAAIVFPQYVPGSTPSLEQVSPALAMTRLLNQVLNPRTVRGKAMPWALQIARSIPCYAVRVDALDEAVAALRGLLP